MSLSLPREYLLRSPRGVSLSSSWLCIPGDVSPSISWVCLLSFSWGFSLSLSLKFSLGGISLSFVPGISLKFSRGHFLSVCLCGCLSIAPVIAGLVFLYLSYSRISCKAEISMFGYKLRLIYIGNCTVMIYRLVY